MGHFLQESNVIFEFNRGEIEVASDKSKSFKASGEEDNSFGE